METELWSMKKKRPYHEDEAMIKTIEGQNILTDIEGFPLLTRVI